MARRLRLSPMPADRACSLVAFFGLLHRWSLPRQSSPDVAASPGRARSEPARVQLVSFSQDDVPSLEGGVGWINSGPIDARPAQGQDRPARLLDLLLHQLPPRPARPGQARGEVQERAGRHRRPLGQVRRRAGHREHPPQGGRVPDQAPGRQRRQHDDLGPVRRQELADAGADRRRTASVDGSGSGEGITSMLDRAIGKLAANLQGPSSTSSRSSSTPEMEQARRTARCSSRARSWPTPRASGCSSPTPATTGSSRPTWTARRPSRSATAREGLDDGGFDKARFNRPQGMCLDGETLYVADTENHAIRAVDLKAKQVTTIAGTGIAGAAQSAGPLRRPGRRPARSAAPGT